jgi:hypothetical protein
MKITQLDAIPQSILINRDGQLNGVFKGGGMGTVTKMRETVDKLMTE